MACNQSGANLLVWGSLNLVHVFSPQQELQQQDIKYSQKEGAKLENMSKNRYKHILPCELLVVYKYLSTFCRLLILINIIRMLILW